MRVHSYSIILIYIAVNSVVHCYIEDLFYQRAGVLEWNSNYILSHDDR